MADLHYFKINMIHSIQTTIELEAKVGDLTNKLNVFPEHLKIWQGIRVATDWRNNNGFNFARIQLQVVRKNPYSNPVQTFVFTLDPLFLQIKHIRPILPVHICRITESDCTSNFSRKSRWIRGANLTRFHWLLHIIKNVYTLL